MLYRGFDGAKVEETKNKQRKYGDQPHRQAREERRATGKKVEIIISVKTVLERSARPQKMVAFEPGPAVRWAG